MENERTMKTSITIGLLSAAIIFIPTMSTANSDNKYPASSFQPKIIYQDKNLIKTSSNTKKSFGKKSTFDPKYPAANFEPKVIYP